MENGVQQNHGGFQTAAMDKTASQTAIQLKKTTWANVRQALPQLI